MKNEIDNVKNTVEAAQGILTLNPFIMLEAANNLKIEEGFEYPKPSLEKAEKYIEEKRAEYKEMMKLDRKSSDIDLER